MSDSDCLIHHQCKGFYIRIIVTTIITYFSLLPFIIYYLCNKEIKINVYIIRKKEEKSFSKYGNVFTFALKT